MLSKLQNLKNALSNLVYLLLKKSSIKIDKDELIFQIKSHPSYPSLHSITGVFDHFNIENLAVKVPVEKSVLEELPDSFIAQLNTDDLVLVEKSTYGFEITENLKKTKRLSQDEFLIEFTGVIVAVEKDEHSNSQNRTNNKLTTYLFWISGILLLTLFLLQNKVSLNTFHFIFSLLGVAVSYYIIKYELGEDSKIISTVCSEDNKKTNCNAVLNSKGATIYKNIKLSDISIIYFTSSILSSLILSFNQIPIYFNAAISLLAIGAVIYSFIYQFKVLKTWCFFCIAISLVLISQAIISYFINPTLYLFKIQDALYYFMFILLVGSIWLFVKDKLQKEIELKNLKIEATKFKRNFELFSTLLNTSQKIDTYIPDISEIIFGNKNAEVKLVIITNPFCGHCREVHSLVEKILNSHSERVSITIRFNINADDTKSDIVIITSKLLDIYHNDTPEKCLEAMHEIYNDNDASKWLKKWNTSLPSNNFIFILKEEHSWCKQNNINFTPEILINGSAYPKAYDRSDLIYFIEELNESNYTNELVS